GWATRPAMLRFTKRAPVADAAAIVDREHRVAATGEILIERVGVVIVVEIMPAEEHLAHGAAVHKDDGGRAAHREFRSEQLAVNLCAISRFEDDLCGNR